MYKSSEKLKKKNIEYGFLKKITGKCYGRPSEDVKTYKRA
jgi:hypothetical protein